MRTATLAAFARVDARNVRRDSLLSVVGVSPLVLALVLRVGFPRGEQWVLGAHGLDVSAHHGFALGLIVVLHVPFIFGMVGSLLVFDDIDDGTLLAIRVTPVTLERYVGYRLAAVTAVSALGLSVAVPLSGLAGDAGVLVLLPAVLLSAVCAPLVTLAALALASNKVEGLAVIKALGVLFYLPLATWFTDAPWTRLLAVLPTYWPVRALWAGLDGAVDVLALAVGAAYSALLAAGLARRVRRRT